MKAPKPKAEAKKAAEQPAKQAPNAPKVKAKAKPQAQPAEPKAKPALSKSDQCECEEDSAGLASCKWCKPREWGLTDNFEPARLHVFNTGQVSARLV